MTKQAVCRITPRDQESQKTSEQIANVTWVGVVINIFLSAFKFIAGFQSGSRALVADAFHSLSDLATDFAILIGVRFWTAPADSSHPYGHRKIETIITLLIGLALAGVGLALAYEAFKNLSRYAELSQAPLIIDPATYLALGAALLSLISKELLYRWTVAKGRAIGSSALVANAWHHRSDAFSSIPPAISIAGAILGERFGYNLWFLDPMCTVAVCLMLMVASWEVIKPTLSTLVDAGADQHLNEAIEESVLSTPGIISAHKIRTRCIGGSSVAVDLHIQVDGSLSVLEGHDLAREIKCKILNLKVEGVENKAVDVLVHVEPAE